MNNDIPCLYCKDNHNNLSCPNLLVAGPTIRGSYIPNKANQVSITGAKKETLGKLMMDLIPPEAIREYAKVLTDGSKKYEKRNWEKGLNLVEHHLAAAMRHINAWQLGTDLNVEKFKDSEGKYVEIVNNHMSHALWHIAAIVTQIARNRTDLDDRIKYYEKK